jgi:hypothetical protein
VDFSSIRHPESLTLTIRIRGAAADFPYCRGALEPAQGALIRQKPRGRRAGRHPPAPCVVSGAWLDYNRAHSACHRRARMLGQEDLRRRLEELRSEHRDLDDVIAQLQETAPFNQLQLQRLKKRKLALKDQIIKLESQLLPDIIA